MNKTKKAKLREIYDQEEYKAWKKYPKINTTDMTIFLDGFKAGWKARGKAEESK